MADTQEPQPEIQREAGTEKSQEIAASLTDDISEIVEDGKNRLTLTCIHCPSKIMTPGIADFFREMKSLPKMNQKKDFQEIEVDSISEWFVLDDVFLFESIGVSHSVGDVKYLSCADCEMGPVGWNDLVTKKYYVAISRVRQS